MPQLRIFLTDKDYSVYVALPEEAQARLRRKMQSKALELLGINECPSVPTGEAHTATKMPCKE